jgi:K+-transporting ATPase KdpF subunit
MSLENLIGLVLSVLALFYLGFAMLQPERF